MVGTLRWLIRERRRYYYETFSSQDNAQAAYDADWEDLRWAAGRCC